MNVSVNVLISVGRRTRCGRQFSTRLAGTYAGNEFHNLALPMLDTACFPTAPMSHWLTERI